MAPKKRSNVRCSPNLGRYKVNIQLLAEQELDVRTIAYQLAFPQELISTTMRDIISELIETQTLNEVLLCQLDKRELSMLTKIIKMSRINDKLLYKIADMFPDAQRRKNELIHKLNIIKGEILAGNNNPSLVSDLVGVLNELLDHKMIQKKFFDQMIADFAC